MVENKKKWKIIMGSVVSAIGDSTNQAHGVGANTSIATTVSNRQLEQSTFATCAEQILGESGYPLGGWFSGLLYLFVLFFIIV